MGFFSWKTADNRESIANCYSGHENAHKTIYLLQPNGKAPLVEPCYEGYGTFADNDAYAWLAKNNLAELDSLDDESIRLVGISLELGIDVLFDDEHMYAFKRDQNVVTHILYKALDNYNARNNTNKTLVLLDGHYDTKFEQLNGKSFNDLSDEIINTNTLLTLNFPLKFSYSKDAVYEHLSASEICEHQGYFY